MMMMIIIMKILKKMIKKRNPNKETIEKLQEDIEELQSALAEERMMNMELDAAHRQSEHRADKLQYELAEEKLKNIYLIQQLQSKSPQNNGFECDVNIQISKGDNVSNNHLHIDGDKKIAIRNIKEMKNIKWNLNLMMTMIVLLVTWNVIFVIVY